MANTRYYRELRPAFEPDSDPSSPTSSLDNASHSSQFDQKPVRRNVWVACESCKKRKTKVRLSPWTMLRHASHTDPPPLLKCSADRPKCSQCFSKGFDCHYTADPSESRNAALKRKYNELERENGTLNEFFCAIRSMPEIQAYEVVRRIRSGASSEDVLRQIEGSYLLLQLSDRPGGCAPRCDMPKSRTMPTLTPMPTGLLTPEDSFESVDYPSTPDSRALSGNYGRAVHEGVAERRSTSETRHRSRGA